MRPDCLNTRASKRTHKIAQIERLKEQVFLAFNDKNLLRGVKYGRPLDEKTNYKRRREHRNAMRSDARELCSAMMSLILHVADFKSGRFSLPISHLAEDLEISYDRATKGMKYLHEAGIVTTICKAIYKSRDGERKPRVAIRRINWSFFRAIGGGAERLWSEALKLKEKWGRKAAEAKERAKERRADGDIGLAVSAGTHRARRNAPQQQSPPADGASGAASAAEKAEKAKKQALKDLEDYRKSKNRL